MGTLNTKSLTCASSEAESLTSVMKSGEHSGRHSHVGEKAIYLRSRVTRVIAVSMLFDEALHTEDGHAGAGPLFLTMRACLLGQSKSPGHEQDHKDDHKQSARSVVVSATKSVATEEKKNQQNDQDYAERRKTGRCDFIG